jgi:hypothetical protein
LQTNPQFGPLFVAQNPFAKKQQYKLGDDEQKVVPALPPCVHIQPFDDELTQHTAECELHPLLQRPSAFPHDLPTHPQDRFPLITLKVFLLYAPVLPGNPPPQQHILDPLPPAPHISSVTAPDPGAIQQNPLHKQEYITPLSNAQIFPCSKFPSTAVKFLLPSSVFSDAI